MSHTPIAEACERIAENCTALVLVAVDTDGETQVHVQEPGLALSLAVANSRLRRTILPQDILRMQAILGELDRAHTPRPATRRRKAAPSQSASAPSSAPAGAKEVKPGN